MASWEAQEELRELLHHLPEDDPPADLTHLLELDEMEPKVLCGENPGDEKLKKQVIKTPPMHPSTVTWHFGYKQKEDQQDNIKMRDWVPDPSKMSKSTCKRLILLGLYQACKAQEIIKMDYDVHWEKSVVNEQYFEVEYNCKMCRTVLHEPMPIMYDPETELWVKPGRLRGPLGSAVYTLKKHYERCLLTLPSLKGTRLPKRRCNPSRRYETFREHPPTRKRRSKEGIPTDQQPSTSNGDPMALLSGPCGPHSIQPPSCLLQELPKPEVGSPEMAVAMSGGPFWEEVYGDSIFATPLGSSEDQLLSQFD
uniref:Protein Bel-1 n=1 Tax=Simian foamy virus type 1 TaxID=338478 RepID=BEL1_SFV1|nr:RecName: Full=Protein Bel-1; AltName: Full=Transactivator of spumavirus; Short=Tas; AltName: Full=Transcriptional transactivator [Macaque simian foamy virus]